MEQLLQQVTGCYMLFMLYGFSGYNKVLVGEGDRFKTAFASPWGTYAYVCIPFGLINAGATFKRAMDYAFSDIINQFLVVYQDDITVFSKHRSNHIAHLRKVFDKCREFKISLNPNKSLFGVTEDKLLGHIVSKEGVRIYPDRVESIQHIPLPRNKKVVQSF